ncbi:MAG: response regulator [Acidobacteria bacterium]|nr:response regulator [Acidobacteriota bacterium]
MSSAINYAQTPQALVCALAKFNPVKFDYCTLVLPETDGQGLRIWRAARSAQSEEQTTATASGLGEAHYLLGRVLARGASEVFDEAELSCDYANHFGHEAKSALALPLLYGGHTFGLVCFSSDEADVYARDEAEKLMWLADHVAAAAQVLMLRARLETQAEMRAEVERLKSGFINTLVRDIRLPLTSVLGLLELFESKIQSRESFDLEDRRLLNSALENGDRMRRLLDDHLEVARQQEQPLELNLAELKATRMLEGIVEPLRGEAALRGVEINVDINDQELALYVDERQTRRALSYLLTAALTATRDGGAIKIEAQEIHGTRVGDEGRRLVIINITDAGEGFPAEEVPFVFDAFWQAPGNRRAGVHGVGLAIVRRIAAAHGGNVTVRSQLGVGTIYSLVLPASRAAVFSSRPCLLVVDDVPDILLLMGKLVERMGYQVEMASCASQALEVLRRREINLLITDWAMPGMNGGELVAALKQEPLWRDIPSIVLTGHDTETEREEALAAGCDCFLVKPVKRDELQRFIKDLLSKEPHNEKGEEAQKDNAIALPL